MKYQRLRGMKDVYAPENRLWETVAGAALRAMKLYNFSLIITPMIEDIGMFTRGVGEGTDIVLKEMYDFKDKGDRHIALRPEGTASVVRAYIENSLPERSDLFYLGPMFRYERPQKGRYREFYQIGAESFGDKTPYKDAEIIKLSADIIKNCGIKDFSLQINSLGADASYKDKLVSYLKGVKDGLCPDCVKKLDRAPVRVLDCKVEQCKKAVENAPLVADNLSPEAKAHYDAVKGLLKSSGVEYKEDKRMVRGLDYYTGVVFEFTTGLLGPQQNTILAGGRYDSLVAELGGKNVPATGFALGIDRMAEVMKASGAEPGRERLDVFIVVDKQYIEKGFALQNEARNAGIYCGMGFEERSFKSQMREAESRGAKFAAIIGENEAKNNTATIKNMSDGRQEEIKSSDAVSNLKSKIENLK